jgi:hypothetical protein
LRVADPRTTKGENSTVDQILQQTVRDMARGSAPTGLCCVMQFDRRIGSLGWYGLTGKGSELDVERQLVLFARLALNAGYELTRVYSHTVRSRKSTAWLVGIVVCAGCPSEDDVPVIRAIVRQAGFEMA